MAKRRPKNISFLQLAPNNRRSKVARMLGWDSFNLSEQQRAVVDRIIQHAADVAEQTMQQHVDALIALGV